MFGEIGGCFCVAMRGRFHTYEGHSGQVCGGVVRLLRLLGAETLLVTNAAGGLNPSYRVGDVVIISDHIGLPLLSGAKHPLVGPNNDDVGPRFPPMSDAYDLELRNLAEDVAGSLAMESFVRTKGVYFFTSGPSYETNAEARAMRLLGADMVGMSTVPEVVVARHCGMRVLGLSLITNVLEIETGPSVVTSHAEVLESTKMRGGAVRRLVTQILVKLTDASYMESLIDDAASFRLRTSATPRGAAAVAVGGRVSTGARGFRRTAPPRVSTTTSLTQQLRQLDVSSMTPVEALEELSRLVAVAKAA